MQRIRTETPSHAREHADRDIRRHKDIKPWTLVLSPEFKPSNVNEVTRRATRPVDERPDGVPTDYKWGFLFASLFCFAAVLFLLLYVGTLDPIHRMIVGQ